MNSAILKFWENEASDKPESTGHQLFFRNIEIAEVCNAIFKHCKVLDAGCGNGYVLKEVHRVCPNVELYGIDFSPKMIKNAKKLMNNCAKFRVADFRKLPYPDNYFNIIYTVRSLINLETDKEQLDALKEFRRVLSPSGIIILVEISQEGFDNTNNFLENIGLNKLKHRWHNKFFSNKLEAKMEKLFLVYKRYYPVTSFVKYTLESLLQGEKEGGNKSYRSFGWITNIISVFTGFFDGIFYNKPFGKHTTYFLLKEEPNINTPGGI